MQVRPVTNNGPWVPWLAQAFEVNNAVPHLVHNLSNTSRIHLIVDVAEAILPPAVKTLQVGQSLPVQGRQGGLLMHPRG